MKLSEMQFIKYSPDTVMKFGKHEGYDLKTIYRFDPNYIDEFLIEFTEIIIDPGEFQILPSPTPYRRTDELKNGLTLFSNPKESDIPYAIELIKNGYIIPSVAFSFSKKTLQIIEEKKAGAYIKSEYANTIEPIISTEEFLKKNSTCERPKFRDDQYPL